MSTRYSVLIRCDASNQIGIGHFMRMLVLAKAINAHQPSIHITFFMKSYNEWIKQTVISDGYDFIDNQVFVFKLIYDLIIVDHYEYEADQLIELKSNTKCFFAAYAIAAL
jgi:spore coat polysaccharide biosynthesis predicted glycosyltransferase SpsG